MNFELSDEELERARRVANRWNSEAERLGANNWLKGNKRPGIDLHVPAAVAQLGASLLLGREWKGEHKPFCPGEPFPQLDGCVIKWTYHRPGNMLIPFYTQQPLDLPWVSIWLDRDEPGSGRLVGWIRAQQGRKPKYWRGGLRSPAWIVPAEMLSSMEDLPDA